MSKQKERNDWYHVAGSLIYSCSSQELLSLYGAPPQGAASNSVDEEFLALAEAIPGQPGEDYPVYSQPPDTSFTCADKIKVDKHLSQSKSKSESKVEGQSPIPKSKSRVQL